MSFTIASCSLKKVAMRLGSSGVRSAATVNDVNLSIPIITPRSIFTHVLLPYTPTAMFATPIRLARGQPSFLRRSLDEFRRQAGIAIRMEGLHEPKKPFPLIKFDAPEMLSLIHI